MKPIWAKVVFSAAASFLLVARLVWPGVDLDPTTISLGLMALLPWLSSLVEGAKLPGGWEIEFRDMEEAGEKVMAGRAVRAAPDASGRVLAAAEHDPNLALVSLRIEIEKRVVRLAQGAGLDPRQPLGRLIGDLHRRAMLTPPAASGLQEIVAAGDRAAHGAHVEPSVAEWASRWGPDILAALDDRLARHQPDGTGGERA